MWLVILWLLTSSAFAAEQSATSKAPCDHWDERFQQRLTHNTIPETLSRILTSHKGHGFSTTFTEEKHIALLRQPLRASGYLTFIPQHGLYRKLQTPFVQELLITPDAIHQRNARGVTEALALDTLPVAKAFVEAFLAVFSGSWETLHTHFQVYFATHEHADGQRWQLGLKPTHQVMGQLISCLVLEGEHERLVTLRVQETNGDITSDHFLQPHILPKEQWDAYRSQFEWSR